MRALTATNGVLLLTVPASPALWSAFDVSVHHRRRYVSGELADKIERAGFSVEFVSPFMTALYPLAWIQRQLTWRFQRARLGADAALNDLRIVPVLNPLLRAVLGWELPRLTARRRLPFGTSLIAVARAR